MEQVSREKCVFLAKLAEQAERYDGTLKMHLYTSLPVYLLYHLFYRIFANIFSHLFVPFPLFYYIPFPPVL